MKSLADSIPITVGIIGHRDAIITDDHRKLIVALFDSIQTEYPNSPVCLFSQLAKGADTAIADLFLSIKEKTKRDYHLIVPLLFSIEKFTSNLNETERQHFNRLLSQATRSFDLKKEPGLSDNDSYRLGGQFVADSSVILIAIWDNEHNGKKGGTADIIKYKIEGSFEDDSVENLFDLKGSVISLPCNRASAAANKTINLPGEPLIDIIRKDASINKTLQKIEQLNDSFKKMNKTPVQQSGNYLYPDTESLDDVNRTLKKYYALIDSQAIDSRNTSNVIIRSLFILGFIIIALFEWYKHMGFDQLVLFVTTVLIGIAFLLFQFSHRKKIHSIFLENRVLAEALRIQFFWNISNLKKSVSQHILRIHRTEFNWIKHILLAINGITYNATMNMQSVNSIKKYWLDDQYNYFDKKIKQTIQTEKWVNTLSKVAFITACLLIFSIFFLKDQYEEHYLLFNILEFTLLDMIVVLIGVLFGIFALAKGFIEKKAYQQTLNQYSLMKDIYKSTNDNIQEIEKESLPGGDETDKIKKLFYLAGKEALIENGNWYLVFKEREPEVEGIGG